MKERLLGTIPYHRICDQGFLVDTSDKLKVNIVKVATILLRAALLKVGNMVRQSFCNSGLLSEMLSVVEQVV